MVRTNSEKNSTSEQAPLGFEPSTFRTQSGALRAGPQYAMTIVFLVWAVFKYILLIDGAAVLQYSNCIIEQGQKHSSVTFKPLQVSKIETLTSRFKRNKRIICDISKTLE
jgi:hypothetical protein